MEWIVNNIVYRKIDRSLFIILEIRGKMANIKNARKYKGF